MLFQLTLPKEAETALKEVFCTQMLLFQWAAYIQSGHETIDDCQAWVATQPDFDEERAKLLFQWIKGSKERRSAFDALLKYGRNISRSKKIDLYTRMTNEQQQLLNGTSGSLTPIIKNNRWMKNITKYMVMFYNEFRSSSGLHKSVTRTERNYTSQKFLQQLQKANHDIVLCSFCQQNAYMHLGGTEADIYIYTDIDHFFPKSSYPHLAIHPYNLIPLCHACNSWRKSHHDPLERTGNRRWNIEDIWTPYHCEGLFNKIAMRLEYLVNKRELPYLKIQEFHLINQDSRNEASIEVWDRIYKPRESWQRSNNIIGEKLFRRVGQYIRMFHLNNDEELYGQLQPYLDELVATFESEELGREPYSFPMLWLLVHILNDEDPASGQTNTPFLNTINAYLEKTLAAANERRQRGSALRAQAAAFPRTPHSAPATTARARRPRARRAP